MALLTVGLEDHCAKAAYLPDIQQRQIINNNERKILK
jgi:hypothetical protein